MKSRRKFIKNAALLGLSPVMLNGLYGCNMKKSTVKEMVKQGFSIDNFGIQLWTVRDFMKDDPKKTLSTLGQYGYRNIESFQGEKGIFWGMDPKDFKSFLSDNNMVCTSSHCDSNYALDKSKLDEFKGLVDQSAEIGIKYLINPYLGGLKTIDEFKAVTDSFNELGEITKAAGIQYGYHNHHYSFQKMEDHFPQDIMMLGSDKDLVEFEMDIYWVVTAGADPVEWLKKYTGRFTLSHIKDRYDDMKVAEISKTEEANGSFGVAASCVLGKGKIDFDEILKIAKEQGMTQWIVEQERYDDMSSMDAAEQDADFMKKYVG